MLLSRFLERIANEHGPESLEAAMVFVMLERPVDELISRALGLGPYHRGKPSPWSHCFLITEPYRGPLTRILDCTIRDDHNRVVWSSTLKEDIEILIESTVGKGAGGIYDGAVGDYADPGRVTARGVKWIGGLTRDQRESIVLAGRDIQERGIRYDLPGLVRELVRLLAGVSIPPGHNRLFCSGFLQAAYRAALGSPGDFAPGIADADTTPDDIWYGKLGIAIADDDSTG